MLCAPDLFNGSRRTAFFLKKRRNFATALGEDMILSCVLHTTCYIWQQWDSSLKKNLSTTVSRGILETRSICGQVWLTSTCLIFVYMSVSKRSWICKSELKNHVVHAPQVKSNFQMKHDPPAQWNITCPERINTGNRISHLTLISQVEISVMGKLEG